ncbi:hypothetical protein ILYODFUR_024663 [Ilyodon furcidens]|uniref:Uncharacterized protein n=1 Tax=Ilyodon furcidens TaxID=33524 RepID=A0ABV0VGT8_9TELE
MRVGDTANMGKKVPGSDETKMYLLVCVAENTLNIPAIKQRTVVAASCCGDAFLPQGQRSWSELKGGWMKLNPGQSLKKPVGGCRRMKTGVEVHLPAGQLP